METNGWKKPDPPASNENEKPKKNRPKKTIGGGIKKTPAKPLAASKVRTGLKEMMAAKRKEMLLQQDPVKASKTPELKKEVAERVFEGGFFSVRSPLRKLSESKANKASSSKLDFTTE